MLEPILQQLGAGNPQLAQLIANNPDQFLQLLGEEVDDDVPLPPGAQAIAVTEEERDAIERVRHLYTWTRVVMLTDPSYAVSASTATLPFRPTSRAIKTRSSRQTFCLTSPTTMTRPRTKPPLNDCMTNPIYDRHAQELPDGVGLVTKT